MAKNEKFASLKGGRRCWAISAIHGDAERLERLHAAIAERIAAGDNLVYLGNLIGRGAAIRETISELLAFRRDFLSLPGVFPMDIAYLRGSQEEMWHKLRQIHLALNPREVLEWMFDHGAGATLSAYGGSPDQSLKAAREGASALNRWAAALRDAVRAEDGHNALMAVLKRAAFTDDGRLLFVHAGIDPTRPLDEQRDSFWWGGERFDAMTGRYGGFAKVIRGRDRDHEGVRIGPVTVTIDGGCGFGGALIAACLDQDGNVVEQIEA
jgi:serine/threonine protein phosphatase 1